jgi:hypothetical protein
VPVPAELDNAEDFTILSMPTGERYHMTKESFCYNVKADGTVGAYVGWYDGRKKTIDGTVAEPEDKDEAEAEVDEDGNPLVYCDFCPSPHNIAYKDYAGECVADNCGNFVCFTHGIGVDDFYCPMHSKCEACKPGNVQATKACVDCAKMLCDYHTHGEDLCKGCWRSTCGDCHGETGAEMADNDSGLCVECYKGADLGSQETAVEDDEREIECQEIIFHKKKYLQRIGSEEVYTLDGIFVGCLVVTRQAMLWRWDAIKKGYYTNVLNDVVKVVDGVASYVGVYNPTSKTIVEKSKCPPYINLGDTVAEIGAE